MYIHTITNDTVYLEPLLPEPLYSIQIIGNRLMRDIPPPQDLLAQRVLDYHQPEVTSPIGRVHLYYHMLVLGYLLDIPHTSKVPRNRLARDLILLSKLFHRLLALDIISDNLSFVATLATVKTASAVLTFVPLDAASQTIVDHI